MTKNSRSSSGQPLRPVKQLSIREQLASVASGGWMVVGLFLDGLAHVELEPESFFTPWHLILYSGFVAAAIAGTVPVLLRHQPDTPWAAAVPVGHGLTLVGVALFGCGALLDLVWHETLGIEVSNEALISPTHLVLLVGGLLALSGPFRSGVRDLHPGSGRRDWWPAAGSLALLSSIAVFFTSYLSPFGREAAASYPATRTHTHELDVATAAVFGQLREVWGIAGILVTTTILVVALLALLRPALPPPGVITALFVWVAIVSPAIGEFRQWFAAVAVAGGGLAADVLGRRFGAAPAVAAVLVAVTWSLYFALLAIFGELQWSPALWSGAIVLSVLTAATLGWLATPRSPTGPWQPFARRTSSPPAAHSEHPAHVARGVDLGRSPMV